MKKFFDMIEEEEDQEVKNRKKSRKRRLIANESENLGSATLVFD